MTETLVIIKGEKLPGEKVWVTAEEMYEVYGRINLCIDNNGESEMIITDITDEGLVVQAIN